MAELSEEALEPGRSSGALELSEEALTEVAGGLGPNRTLVISSILAKDGNTEAAEKALP